MKAPEKVFDVWRDGVPIAHVYSLDDLRAIPIKQGDLVFEYTINNVPAREVHAGANGLVRNLLQPKR